MHIVVIGGVAAGTKTAAKLMRRDRSANVTVYTKSRDISYAGCGLPYYVGGDIHSRDELIVNTPAKYTGLTGVSVKTGMEAVSVEDVYKRQVWQGGAQGEERLLRACYRNCLELALSRGLGSIAFPLISSGIFGYPKAEALAVAVSEISRFLTHEEMQVFIVVYDARSFELSRQVFDSVASYIDDVYVDARNAFEARAAELEYVRCAQAAPAAAPSGLSAALDRLDESFSEALLRLIDEKGMTDVEVYRRANIDRKHFSKIRTNRDYNPSKRTALALAVALRLTLAETRELLARAGFAISHSNKFDVVVEYFISTGNYDIFEINEALFAFDQPQLGG